MPDAGRRTPSEWATNPGGDPPSPGEVDLAAVLDGVPTMVAYWSEPDLRLAFANRAFREFFGAGGDVSGTAAEDLLGGELLKVIATERAAAHGGTPPGPTEFIAVADAGGVNHWLRLFAREQSIDGEVTGVVTSIRDVTAIRDVIDQMAAQEAEFRFSFEVATYGRALLDARGTIRLVNDALGAITGRAWSELVGTPIWELFPEDARAAERERIQAIALVGGAVAGDDCELERADGRRIWVALSVAFSNRAGDELGVATLRDIGAQKSAERALRESARRLGEAERIAAIGSWEFDLRTQNAVWSPGMYAILARDPRLFDPAEVPGPAFTEAVSPEDRPLVERSIEEAVADGRPRVSDFRGVRGDGRVRDMRTRVELLVDENGEPARIAGILQDVSEAVRRGAELMVVAADLDERKLERQRETLVADEPAAAGSAMLTARQLEVLKLIARGHSNRDIAERLFISPGTVKWHVKQILANSGASTRAEAVARFLGESPR